MSSAHHVPVLIVGAGFAGLAAAALLAWRGVPCSVVERRASISRHPRAHGLNLRSLELLRVIPGLEDELRSATRAAPGDSTVIVAESLTSPALRTIYAPGSVDTRSISPAFVCSAGQDKVEPVLLRHARKYGADIRFSTEMIDLRHDADGVMVSVRDVASGVVSHYSADYLIAADGAHSTIRRKLQVDMKGRGVLSHSVSILFEADLSAHLITRGFLLCYLRNPEFTGVFVTTDDANCGQLNVEYDPRFVDASDFDEARCEYFVRTAVGRADIDVKVLEAVPWAMCELLADRMKVGRVFLVGDAAHVMPPVGGLGGQTGIQDAADLAWKLGVIYHGHARAELLDSYESERRPIAELTMARQIENYVDRMRPDRDDLANGPSRFEYLAVAMGYRYLSPNIFGEGDDQPVESPFHPTGRPGARLPHTMFMRDDLPVSSHDLVGHGFLLIAARDGIAWADAARAIARQTNLPLASYLIGQDLRDPEDAFVRTTRIATDGAVLVRPDGFIAWRSKSDRTNHLETLTQVMERVLCRELASTISSAY